ncbi:MAG: hypothetical protein RLW61_08745 [Gammaproteobacteria bacterium]
MSQAHMLPFAAVLVAALASGTAVAVPDGGDRPATPPNDPPALEELRRIIDESMPEDVQENNGKLLASLLQPRVAQQGPSDVFDPTMAPRQLGMRRPRPSKDCFAPPPRFDCELVEGTREGGGAFRALAADSLGNISYLNRLPDPSKGAPEQLPAVQLPTFSMSDEEAAKSFFDVFTSVFGVPAEEAPDVASWQVEKLLLGLQNSDEPGKAPEVHVIAGVVQIPRMLAVEGLSVPRVPVLGSHVQGSMDDLGRGLPFRVEVQEWTRFTFPQALGRAQPRTRSALVGAIADQMVRNLREPPKAIDIRLAYAKVGEFEELGSYGGPDSDETMPQDGIPDAHRYVPVLLTSVSPLAPDASEEEQAGAFSSAGEEIVTPLFDLNE